MGLLVELDPLELAVLHHAAGSGEALEDILAELRRRHHDEDFWAAPAADPFPVLPDALEALRGFALRAGFYATTHAPLESLRRWAQPALQALLQAQVWSAEAGHAGALAAVGTGADPGRGRRGRLAAPATASGRPCWPAWRVRRWCWWGTGRRRSRQAHQEGRLFQGEPFGLRCLAGPESRHPQRPAAGFEHSLETLITAVEQLYRERPFSVLVSHAGAYRLPLLQAIASRFGVLAVGCSPALWLDASPEPQTVGSCRCPAGLFCG